MISVLAKDRFLKKVCLQMGTALVSLMFVVPLPETLAAEEGVDDSPKRATQIPPIVPEAMIVPVYPKPEGERAMPKGADFRDSYIVLEDGSVLSVADWILGGLHKDKAGADMSDYESRLFLGQVARSMAGMNETLVHDSLIYTKPTVTYFQPKDTRPAVLKWGAFLLRSLIPIGQYHDYDPATAGFTYVGSMDTGTGTAHFENQFSAAIEQSSLELHEQGIMMDMLERQKKSLSLESYPDK